MEAKPWRAFDAATGRSTASSVARAPGQPDGRRPPQADATPRTGCAARHSHSRSRTYPDAKGLPYQPKIRLLFADTIAQKDSCVRTAVFRAGGGHHFIGKKPTRPEFGLGSHTFNPGLRCHTATLMICSPLLLAAHGAGRPAALGLRYA